jgi:hypothetical protein
MDQGLRRSGVLSGRNDLDVAHRVKADGQQQGKVIVVGRGLERPSPSTEPAALGGSPAKYVGTAPRAVTTGSSASGGVVATAGPRRAR